MEVLNSYEYYANSYCDKLLKTKDRNGTIRKIELSEINNFVGEYDCSVSSVHDRDSYFLLN